MIENTCTCTSFGVMCVPLLVCMPLLMNDLSSWAGQVIPEYQLALQMACEEKLSLMLHLKRQVMNINHASLTELRAQQRPPQQIEDLLAGIICIVKSPTADLSWTKGAKRLMANVDRFQELLLGKCQTEDNSETILSSVGPIASRVALSVDELGSHPGGLAATQLLEWVQGVVKLHSVLQTRVRPLEARLDTMSVSLHECEEKLRLQEDKMQARYSLLSGTMALRHTYIVHVLWNVYTMSALALVGS